MKPISDFFPRLLPYLPGCSEPLAAQAVLDAAIEFCDKTLVVRHVLDAVSTVAATGAYELDVPSQQEVSRILHASIDGVALSGVPNEAAFTDMGTQARPLAYYTTRNDAEFYMHLYPVPDNLYSLSVQVALRPTRGATQLDDELSTRWMDAIVDAALSRLKMVPGQPFTDPTGAIYYGGMAARLANSARIEGTSGRLRGSLAVTQRPFA